MAQISVTITVTAVAQNSPPEYAGPTEILDGVVGGTFDLGQFGFDADGDTIIWSMEPNSVAEISEAGLISWLAPGTTSITVTLSDGKP